MPKLKILITGGQGFIGTSLVPLLEKLGEVSVLDLKSGRDIRTDALIDECDIVFHLAALRSVPKSFEIADQYFSTNVFGTYRILEAFKGKRIVNISTSSALNPIAPYGLSKLLGEKIAERYDNVISMRLFNPFGPGGLCDDLVVPIFIEAMKRKEPVYIHSDGKQDRDFTFVDDVVREIVSIGMSDRTGVCDVGYGESHSVNEVFDILARALDYNKRPIHIAKRIGDQVHTRANHIMTFKPIGFYEGLERTVKAYGENDG